MNAFKVLKYVFFLGTASEKTFLCAAVNRT